MNIVLHCSSLLGVHNLLVEFHSIVAARKMLRCTRCTLTRPKTQTKPHLTNSYYTHSVVHRYLTMSVVFKKTQSAHTHNFPALPRINGAEWGGLWVGIVNRSLAI